MRKKIELDTLEMAIEARSDEYVSMTGERRKHIETLLERARKTRNINIRISECDLAALKRKAEREGIPYQTLIASVLHKFVADRLVDEEDMRKTLQLIESR